MRQRRETVEHLFGTIKARMGATHFLMKTLPRVAAEMAPARLGLQSDARDEYHRHQAVDRRSPGMNSPGARLSAATKLSSDPAAAFLHDQDSKRTSLHLSAPRTPLQVDSTKADTGENTKAVGNLAIQ
jgi:hypothetical protein